MKTRPNKIARSVVRRGRFALHPLSFAICLGLSGAALALPQGGRVVAGDATISKPSTDSEVIRQTTDKAIVDWKSFSIAAGEKVRFYQPSSTSVTLNRVTGFDPSYILGQMSSNGKIFLVNPYGVVFGAGARVDVGGLVVSTLSIANNDFLAGRYSLTSVDPDAPAQRGAIRNEGTISSPGGLVVLAGPSVSNTGTIVANGGRVGLVAANAVSVDVEGDGLLFFQTSATEAKNRLEQLGRIQADGGTVEMRAAARGAFADTVLNMTGVVQARAIGSREGKIVIDGGSDGVTAVSGRLDATGLAAGERGGSVTVAGQRVLLDNGSVVEASGNAGGGSIRIGGGFHGADSDIHNAEVTGVASGAVVRADATESGDGGKVAIWADGTTRFYGTVSAQGGKTAGDGGFVEVSGKQNLVFRGDVSTLAPKGKNGTLLLDPADIVIAAAPSSLDDTQLDANVPTVGDAAGLIKAGDAPVGTATISTAKLEAIGAANSINLNASNSITVNALTSNVATPNTLTLNTAGGGAQFHAGAGGFTMQAGDTIKVTNGSLTIDAAGGTVNVGALQASGAVALSGTGVTLNAPISVTAAGAGVTVTGPTTLVGTGGAISLTGSNAANDVTLGTVNGAGRTLNVTAGGGDIVLGAVGGGAALAAVTLSGNTASLGAVTTTGAQNYSAVATTTLGGTLTVNTAGAGVSAGATALGAGGGTITLTGSNAANDVTLGTVSGARPLVITAGGGDVILGAATGLTSTTITANTADLQAVTTSGAQNYSAVTTTTLHDTLTVSVAGAGVSAGATTLAAGGGTIALTGSNAANDVTLGAVNGPSTLDITANGGDVTLGTVGAGTALAGVSIAANTAALQNVTTNGNQTYNAVVSAAGVTLDAGTGSIAANNANNDFTGPVTLKSSGASVSIRDVNNLTLAAPTLGNTSLTAIASGTLTLPAGAINAGTGDLDLRSLAGTLATAGPLAANNISLTGSGGITLGDNLNAINAVSLSTTNTAITESAGKTITAGGATSFNAGSGAVTLDQGNAFTSIGGTGGTVIIHNSGDLALDAINATTLTIDTSAGNGAVTQNAAAVVTGATVVGAGSGAIALSNASNDFFNGAGNSFTGGAISVRDTNALTVTTLANGPNQAVSVIAGGALTLPAGVATGTADLTLSSGAALATPGTLSGNNISLTGTGGVSIGNDVTAAGNLSLNATNTAVNQTAGTIVSGGTTTVTAGTGAVTLARPGNDFNSINVVSGGVVNINDTNAITAAANVSGALTITSIGALSSGGTLSGTNVVLTGNAGINLAHNVNATGTLQLTTTNTAIDQTAGAITAGNLTTASAGTGDITLNQAGNDFSNASGINASGGAVRLRDTNALLIAGLSVGANKDLSLTGGTTVSGVAGPIDTGSADLAISAGTGFTTFATLRGTNITLSGGTGGLSIGHNITALNNLALNSTNSAITQTAGLINASGATTFNAGSGAVTLNQANILNSIGGTGGTVSVSEASPGGVVLAATNAANLTVTTTQAGAPVTQNAPLVVTGATTINTTGGGAVTLADPGNDFGSFGATAGAVSVADGNAIALNAVNATSLLVNTSAGNGAVTQTAALNVSGATTINAGTGAITLGAANTLGSFGATGGAVSLTENSAGGIALDDVNATSLSVNTSAANGDVTQTALKALTVTGATAVNAGTGAVTLANAGNNFGSVGAIGGAVSIRDSNALALDAINATTLTVDTSAGNGAVTQNAAAIVTGATVVTTGSGAITLGNPGNDFGNLPGNSFTGGAISLRDTNDLTVTTLSNGANQAVSVSAGLGLTLPGGVTTGTADLTLSSGAILTTPGVLSGNNVSLTGTGGVTIGNNVTATGNLALNTTNTAVNQTAGTIVSGGTTTVTAGTGTVTLAQPLNDFNSINVVSGGIVAINDRNALTAAANASGTLTITSTGPLSSGGTLAGTNVDLTGSGGITLANNVNASGTLQLTTTNAAINQTAGAITAGGLTTVSAGTGDITLNQAGNDFSNVSGISVSGGAVRLSDANTLNIVSLVNGANKDLSLTAGTAILGVSGNIDTGTADLTISAGGGFTTFGTLRGTNVTVGGGAGGVSIGHNITALNDLTLTATNAAITQTAGTISAAGTTTANAGTGNISLALAGNNFATFAATGNAVTVRDDNGLALGPIAATTLTLDSSAGNGAVTQSGPAVVTGTTTITAGSGAVTLTNPGNDFADIGVSGGAVSITDSNALALNTINATSLTLSAGGPITQNAAAVVTGATTANAGANAITLNNAGNNFGSVGATGGAVAITDSNALALDAINATSLTLNTAAGNGSITQNAAAVVAGATSVNSGTGAVTLNNVGNNFGSVGATGGAVAITDSNALALDAINATSLTLNTAAGNGNITQNAAAVVAGATTVNAGTGAVTLTNAGNNFASVAAIGGAVSVTDLNALTLGAINATTLTVDTSAGNGAVTQTAAAIVSGATNVSAGTGAVTLANAGNDFATLGVTGGAVSIVDSNALTLSSLASAPNQAVSVTAAGALTLPATAIDTGAASLTLASGGPLLTVGTLRGTNVALNSGGAMTLANNVTALGTLGLTSTNAAILQSGGTIVAGGATTVNAGSGNITLAQLSNDFQGNVSLSGGAVSVHDTNNLTVSSLTSGANQPVSLIAGGSLVLPAVAIDTGTADLTLQALGGSLAINGPLNGNNVTLTGTAGLTLGANITSTGAQIYTTPVQLSGNVTLNSGASKIDLQGGANGGGNNLALTSSNAAADAIHTGAAISNTAQFTVTGNSTLGGNVTTTGNQTYTGPVTLGTDVALAAGAAKIDLQSGVDAGGHNLALTSGNAAADAIRAGGAITNATQLTVTGKSTLASGVTTTGTQLYSDTVTLGSSSNFVGSGLTFGNGIVAGAFDLGLQSDALALNGVVSGSGNAALSSLTQNASVGVAGGAGTYQLSQATLDRFATFGTLTVGRADGTGDLTFGNLVLPTNFAVQSASGNANFTGTVASAAGQSRNLTVTTGGTTTFAGAVGGAIGGPAALGSLTVAGNTNLNANATTNGSQSFGGAVTVGADTTLSATAVSFGSSLNVGTRAVTILSDALSLAGPAAGSGAGSVRLAPKNASGSIGVAGGAGTLQVSQGLVNTLAGVPSLTLGRADSTGTVTVGNLVLPGDLAIGNGSGNVAFTGTVDSAVGPARDLVVTTTGTTSFAGAVGGNQALDVLSVSGPSQLGANVVTSGAQTYTGAATLAGDSTLTGPSVSFGSTVDGARALTVNAGATNFAGAVGATTALTSLTTDAAGTTQLAGNVTTTSAQTYNDALQLNANTVLSGTTLTLAGSVNGARNLTVNGTTGVTLGSAIGATTPLTGLSVSGPLQLNSSGVTTTGAQTYSGTTTLGASTVLTAPSIVFGNTLDGPFALTLQSAGPTSFAGAVGAAAALASLTANGGGAVQLAGPSIDTTGAQSYSGALQLAGNTRLSGSALTLTGAVSGATDLTLQTNSLSGGTSLAGSGVLTIAPVDPTLSVGVAGGAGTLQVGQAVLDGATGFTGHVIGRSDGSGTVSAGNLVLRADTTLQTATGDMNLGGSVDGAFALTLNSGGTTRITGPVGVGTALKSLTTDNSATAVDWNGTSGERTSFDTADGTGSARIVTSGAQTYNDPVTASVPVAFTGGAITATQATNRFDGVVSGNVASLDLRSSADLLLGALSTSSGGTIEADGVLHLTGALQLNGGTLVLKSNATPTPVDLTDPEFAGKTFSFGFVPVKEASATIVQDAGATLGSAAGSVLVLRSPAGGSILLDKAGNTLLGDLSAVSGTLGDNDPSRFNNANALTLGFIRIASSEIHVAGSPPSNGDQTLALAGIEGDVVKLTADVLTTGPTGLIRARLPFNNIQGSQTSVPGLTLVMSPTALTNGGGFGSSQADTFIQIQVGGTEGGFLTARPKGVGGNTAVIFLGGNAAVRPFYDGTGKLTEIRIFYNGDAPRTPQEAGALAAVIALIEEARHARFEEAVRTENVSSRLRSGVIAEVGAGRPATVGRESIRLPDTCDIKSKTLQCE